MNRELSLLRDHMLSAKPPDRWETAHEIANALRTKYGLVCTRTDVIAWLRDLAMDQTYRIIVRTREDSSAKEYRLFLAPTGAQK